MSSGFSVAAVSTRWAKNVLVYAYITLRFNQCKKMTSQISDTYIACKIILLNSLVLIVVYKHWNKHRTLKINPSKCQLVMFGGHNLKYCPVIFLKSCGALTSVITSTPTLCVTRRILAFRVYVRLKLQRETWE